MFDYERNFFCARHKIKTLIYKIKSKNKYKYVQSINRKKFYNSLIFLIDQYDTRKLLYMDYVLLEAIEYWKTGVKNG